MIHWPPRPGHNPFRAFRRTHLSTSPTPADALAQLEAFERPLDDGLELAPLLSSCAGEHEHRRGVLWDEVGTPTDAFGHDADAWLVAAGVVEGDAGVLGARAPSLRDVSRVERERRGFLAVDLYAVGKLLGVEGREAEQPSGDILRQRSQVVREEVGLQLTGGEERVVDDLNVGEGGERQPRVADRVLGVRDKDDDGVGLDAVQVVRPQ